MNRIDVTEQIEAHVAKLLKDGILERSFSAYNSPLLLIRKPDGGTRICLDCRALNLKIKPSFNYLHDLEHTIQKIQSYNGKFFSTLDIKNAFYAIELHPDSRHITNFTVPSGSYSYKRLVQGLNTSPSVFCQIINTIFNDKNNNLAIYLDDLILANKTFDAHLENLRTVLQRSLANNLRINGHKCKLFAERVPFLGKVLSAEGCHVSEDKIKALRTLEPPKNVKELRRFMGSCGYVRRHIPNYSHLVSPLTRLLRKDTPYIFDSSCQEAFERLKMAFNSPAVLRNFTPGKDVYLYVDASNTAIASVLFQKDEKTGQMYLVDTFGKQVDKHQKFYTITELELLSIVSSLSAYRQYLSVTTNIFVKSDHISLTFWRNIKNHPVGRINRWAQILSQYPIKLDWIRGKDNHIADLISRRNYTDETSSKLNYDAEQELNETVMVLQNELTHDTLNSSCYEGTETTDLNLGESHSQFDRNQNRNSALGSVLSNEEIFKLTTAIVSLDNASNKTSRFSDAIINKSEFCLRSVNDSPEKRYTTTNKPVFIRSDYDMVCHNISNTTDLHDCLHKSLTASLCAIETDTGAKVIAAPSGNSSPRHLAASEVESPEMTQPDASNRRDNEHIALNRESSDPTNTRITDTNEIEATDRRLDFNREPTFQSYDGCDKTDVNTHRMFDAQRSDSNLAEMIAYLELNQIPDNLQKARLIAAESNDYFIDEETGLLYHIKQNRAKRPIDAENLTVQLVIPHSKIHELLTMAHDSKFGAHFSADYLYQKLSSWCFFKKMYSIIQSHTKYCATCQLSKAGLKPKHPPLTNPAEIGKPFSAYVFDILKLSLTERGNQYALIFVDKNTHMCFMFAIPNQNAETVAYHLYNSIICNYGVPDELYSDRAAAFIGKIMTSLTELYGIKHTIASSRHPQSSGIIERLNKQLVNTLRCIPDSATRWDVHLNSISMAYRCTPTKALSGYSPFELAHGTKMKTIEEHIMTPKSQTGVKNVDEYVSNLREQLSLVQNIVAEGRKRYLADMKAQYDKTANSTPFELNSVVMVKREYFKIADHAKLYSRFIGPKRIVERNLHYNTYLLRDLATNEIDRNWVHGCKLKSFHMRSEQSKGSKPRETPVDDSINSSNNALPPSSQSPPSSGDADEPKNAGIPEVTDTRNPDAGNGKDICNPDANVDSRDQRRSARLKDKPRINFSDLADKGRKTVEPPKPEPGKVIKRGIIKQTPQPNVIPRFAKFRSPGRSIEGRTRFIQIEITKFIRSRKRRGNLDFYVELTEPHKNNKFVWVSEFLIEPKLNGIRIQFDQQYPQYY